MLRVVFLSFGLLAQACSAVGDNSRARSQPAPDTKTTACLQEAIYFEAGNAGPKGRAAVAHVILNRVADARFPNDVCAVIREGEAKGRCQFSYRCNLDPTRIRWPKNHAVSGETARAVLEQSVPDPTDGALYFHAATIAPGWFATLNRTGSFGGNIFYR